MPLMSRWFVKTSLVYLCMGFALGASLLWMRATGAGGWLWQLLHVHVAWLLFGWMMQLAMGVAYWIMPRTVSANAVTRPREWLAWASYVSLNLSLTLFTLAALLPRGPSVLRVVPSALLAAAVILYAGHLWPRVRAVVPA